MNNEKELASKISQIIGTTPSNLENFVDIQLGQLMILHRTYFPYSREVRNNDS